MSAGESNGHTAVALNSFNKLNGNGATIKLNHNNYDSYAIIQIIDKGDISIENITIIGDREKELLKLNHKLTNIRQNYLHQITSEIIKREPSFVCMEDLKLSDRIYKCECGNVIDRDYQASLNLKRYGEMVLEQSVA